MGGSSTMAAGGTTLVLTTSFGLKLWRSLSRESRSKSASGWGLGWGTWEVRTDGWWVEGLWNKGGGGGGGGEAMKGG